MSATFDRICELAATGDLLITEHAFDRLAKRGILAVDIKMSVTSGIVIEDYPNFYAGPNVLVLQVDRDGYPLHAVWGLKTGTDRPGYLVTAYRPNPAEWTDNFRRRIS